MPEFLRILLILLGISILTGSASAGAFVVDTSGISVSVGETVQVPVLVKDAEKMSGCQLLLNTGNTASAKISVNASSASQMTYSDDTGILIWAGALKSETISGDKMLFLLDVTVKDNRPVPLSVQVTQTFEGLTPAVQVENYAGFTATLKTGKNSGGGEPLLPTPTAVQTSEMTKPAQEPHKPAADYTPAADTEPGFSIPYWIIIVLAVSGLVLLTVILKR